MLSWQLELCQLLIDTGRYSDQDIVSSVHGQGWAARRRVERSRHSMAVSTALSRRFHHIASSVFGSLRLVHGFAGPENASQGKALAARPTPKTRYFRRTLETSQLRMPGHSKCAKNALTRLALDGGSRRIRDQARSRQCYGHSRRDARRL